MSEIATRGAKATNDIKDIRLAEEGRRRTEWAEPRPAAEPAA